MTYAHEIECHEAILFKAMVVDVGHIVCDNISGQNSTLVRVMACCRPGEKPMPDPTLTHIYGTICRHKATVG